MSGVQVTVQLAGIEPVKSALIAAHDWLAWFGNGQNGPAPEWPMAKLLPLVALAKDTPST